MHIFAAEKGDDGKDAKPLLRVLVNWLGTPPDDYPYLAEMKRRIPRELAATRPATRTCQIFRGRIASLPIYLAQFRQRGISGVYVGYARVAN